MDTATPESARTTHLTGLRNAQLLYQYDTNAGMAVFYPREVGPSGIPGALEWRCSSGRGVVYSTTEVCPKGKPPYNIALVEMEEGFRMMSTVVLDTLADMAIGMRVQAAFEDIAGTPRVVFRLA
ncbi:Zn-ribbon domain-containing OB-fold protein [Burkholderia sp. S171]|uniref:Zn-ribbon domain-containing OB-fold protein n=1 Tax=Burkholderia sp. S171 TaxID=1641860 RepID=UPI00131B37C7|nr:OB-fold domain-containing protein [Burkholderia sp. S171]